jgi:enterochelin esterase-like enzyme
VAQFCDEYFFLLAIEPGFFFLTVVTMNPEYIGLQSILTTHLELSGALVPVRFQLHAPEARSVSLIGEMTDWQQSPIPLERSPDGLWHTTLRLRQGQWCYKFIVDERFVEDPDNPLKADDGWGGYHSCLLIGDGDWALRQAISYGEIVRIEIYSEKLARNIGFHLYLPPGYNQRRAYPLLYLLHGYRTRVNQWQSNGMIRQFMGNLMAQSLIEPFIIVMPDTCEREQADAYSAFLATDLYNWLHDHFSLAAGPQFAAVAGMSQFSLSAFRLLHEYPENFGFVAPVSAFFSNQYLHQLEQQTLSIAAGIKLYCGTEDYVFERNERFAAILRKNGIRFDYMRITGDHTWHYWNTITRDLLIAVSEFFTGHNELVAPAEHHTDPIYE